MVLMFVFKTSPNGFVLIIIIPLLPSLGPHYLICRLCQMDYNLQLYSGWLKLFIFCCIIFKRESEPFYTSCSVCGRAVVKSKTIVNGCRWIGANYNNDMAFPFLWVFAFLDILPEQCWIPPTIVQISFQPWWWWRPDTQWSENPYCCGCLKGAS